MSFQSLGFPGGTSGKEPACQSRRYKNAGSTPGSGRYCRGVQGNPLQYSCLENPMDRGAWGATVHRVTKSWTQLKQVSMHTCRIMVLYYSVQFSHSVMPTLCDPTDCSMPGLPVHHQLLKFTQTHVHWVGDAIQPSHPLWSPSPPALNLSQHQGLFQQVSCLHQVAKVLEFQF